MIAFHSDTCIWLVAGVTDMHKSFNGPGEQKTSASPLLLYIIGADNITPLSSVVQVNNCPAEYSPATKQTLSVTVSRAPGKRTLRTLREAQSAYHQSSLSTDATTGLSVDKGL